MPGEKKELLPVRLKTGADRSAAGKKRSAAYRFGGASSPDCRHYRRGTPGIDFNKLDFTNFMDDLMKNQKIPENDVLTNKTRERIKEIMSQQSAQ
uniref:TraN n=1 Tax=Klebsiella pneumoniae TaxID=573 RepID=A0A809T403_KLEPN|nr:hypothetical protein [Klebsiella pneumoniae]